MIRDPSPKRWLIAAVAGVLLSLPLHAQTAGEGKDPAEIQAEAQRRMAALEETMDRLARLLEIDEPENAVKLREAYKRARASFLSENMDKIVEFLEGQRLEEAIGTHGEVSIDLEGLLDILTGDEIDEDAIQKEIKRLEAIKKKLGELEAVERELKEESDAMAVAGEGQAGEPGEAGEASEGEAGEGKPGEGKPGAGKPSEKAEEAKGEQDKALEQTDELIDEMEQGGENGEQTPGTEAAKAAASAMGQASQSLGQGQPGEASGEQQEAADKLQEAQEQVQEQIDALKEQLQSAALAMLKERFEEMLEEQKEITTKTTEADDRLGPVEERELERKDRIELAKLSKRENGLEDQADDSKTILEEEGTSVVFPKVLEMLILYLVEAKERLAKDETGKRTNVAQKEAEQILEEMIAAIDKEMEHREQQGCGT